MMLLVGCLASVVGCLAESGPTLPADNEPPPPFPPPLSDPVDATPAVCGDGVVTANEACDDGVNNGAYARCMPGCLARAAHCGDGRVDAPYEACDGEACAVDCKSEAAHCGDGRVDRGERCDDGNDVDGDGCNVDCRRSGRVRWTRVLDDAEPAVSVAVLKGDTVVVALQHGTVVALDALGERVWEAAFDGVQPSRLTGVSGDEVWLAGARNQQGWSARLGVSGANDAGTAESKVQRWHVATTDALNRVVRLGPDDVFAGNDWWLQTESDQQFVTLAPTSDGGVVLVTAGDHEGTVLRVDAGGSVLWSDELPSEPVDLHVLADDIAVVATASMLTAIDRGGDAIWRWETSTPRAISGIDHALVVVDDNSVTRVTDFGVPAWTTTVDSLDDLTDVAVGLRGAIYVVGSRDGSPGVAALSP